MKSLSFKKCRMDSDIHITIYPYLIGGNIIQMVLGLILLLYPTASKTWLKNELHFFTF